MTTDTFIEKARVIHGDKYDYSKVEYKNTNTKIIISCPEHGDFTQIPRNHIQGKGCLACGRVNPNPAITTESFIEKARVVHGDKYDYSATVYSARKGIVSISCPEHGEFLQLAGNHLQGKGCPACGMQSTITYIQDHCTNTTDTFIEKARTIHGDKYDYSKVEYKNNAIKVPISCPEHGEFSQRPNSHLQGNGCPACGASSKNGNTSISKAETELLEYIQSLYSGTITTNDKSIITPMELDIYLPALNLAIEYNGGYWHSEEYKNKSYHHHKYTRCLEAGIRLITIWEWEWKESRNKIEQFLHWNIIPKTPVYARTLTLAPVPVSMQRSFLEAYHLQGYVPSTIMLGLWRGEELIQVMGMICRSKDTNTWEITRLCTKAGYRVTGGSKKLYSALLKECKPSMVYSYNNLDKFSGLVYSELGLQYESTSIGYGWYKAGQYRTRYSTQKKKLLLEGCPTDKSESTWMREQGWNKVHNTGVSKYVAHY